MSVLLGLALKVDDWREPAPTRSGRSWLTDDAVGICIEPTCQSAGPMAATSPAYRMVMVGATCFPHLRA